MTIVGRVRTENLTHGLDITISNDRWTRHLFGCDCTEASPLYLTADTLHIQWVSFERISHLRPHWPRNLRTIIHQVLRRLLHYEVIIKCLMQPIL